MPRGLSLHLGLNAVDPQHYGWPGTLAGCENDARAMERVARERGYQTRTLLTREATSAALLGTLREAAASLGAGDTLLLTYAGHGSQAPTEESSDEDDGLDETWVLYDRMFLDDELYQAWKLFAPGVRIVLVSDSCHSGTVARVAAFSTKGEPPSPGGTTAVATEAPPTPRAMPREIAREVVAAHRDVYGRLLSAARSRGPVEIGEVRAGVILLSGCMDNQLSADGEANGYFTSRLLEVLRESPADYPALHRGIDRRMPAHQKPNYMKVGHVEPSFEYSVPLSLTPRAIPKGWCQMLGTGLSANNRPMLPMNGNGFGGGPWGSAAAGRRGRAWEVSGGVSFGSRCVLDMDMDVGRLRGMSDEQIYAFFQGDGANLLMQAFVNARDAGQSLAASSGSERGWEITVGGKIGGRADWGVEVKGTWHF